MKTFFFLAIALFLSGCAPRVTVDQSDCLTSINLLDQDGLSVTVTNTDRLQEYLNVDFCQSQPYQKVLRVYGRDCQGNIRAIITSYHPNGQVKQYLEVLNNRACGAYREWFSNGVKKVDASVIGGASDINTGAEKTWIFEGVCCAFDEQGALIAKINYCKGSLEGDSLYYHPGGTIWKKVPFSQGQMEGIYEMFSPGGTLIKTEPYCKGKLHGKAYRYWKEGQIASEECYVNGLLKEAVYFLSSGEEVSSITEGCGFKAVFGKQGVAEMREYKDGVPEGEVSIFSKEGTLLTRYALKDGLKHGEEIEYYQKRTLSDQLYPKLSVQWYQGMIQGVVKTWYDNQVQESQREMCRNVKTGHAIAWYRDGSLMLEEEYENSKLVMGEYYKRGDAVPLSDVRFGKGTATLFDGEGNFVKKVEYFNYAPVN